MIFKDKSKLLVFRKCRLIRVSCFVGSWCLTFNKRSHLTECIFISSLTEKNVSHVTIHYMNKQICKFTTLAYYFDIRFANLAVSSIYLYPSIYTLS